MKDEEDFQHLKSLIIKDPSSYKEELTQQIRRFNALHDLISIRNTMGCGNNGNLEASTNFTKLINFLSNLAPHLKEDCKVFPGQVMSLASNIPLISSLHSETRLAIIQSLLRLHNHNLIQTLQLLPVFFNLFSLPDKPVRNQIFLHLVKNIAQLSKKTPSSKLANKNFGAISAYIKHDSPVVVKKAIGVLAELYRKKVWRNAKVANALSEGCFSKHSSASRKAMRFLLGEACWEEDEDLAEEKADNLKIAGRLEKQIKGNKRCGKREKKLERMKKKIKKNDEKRMYAEGSKLDFSAIRSINDPHTFGEKLFKELCRCRENFETKLLLMKLISRVISCHELTLVNFYSYLQRYMQPHQRDVTKVLTYLVQASHSLVPKEYIQPCIKTLAYNFITDRSNEQTITVGINTIREICARHPAVLEEYLLHDLIQYKTSKEKSITVAARGLISFFRESNPKMLPKKERGRKPAAFAKASEESDGKVDKTADGMQNEAGDLLPNMEGRLEDGKTDLLDGGSPKESSMETKFPSPFKFPASLLEEMSDEGDLSGLDGELDKIIEFQREAGRKPPGLIEAEKAEKKQVERGKINGKKAWEKDKSNGQSEGEEITPEFPVNEDDLLGSVYKKRRVLEEKVARKKNKKYNGSKKGGGTTNEDKKRRKNFKLTKHSGQIRSRNKLSLGKKRVIANEHSRKMKLKSRRKFKKKAR